MEKPVKEKSRKWWPVLVIGLVVVLAGVLATAVLAQGDAPDGDGRDGRPFAHGLLPFGGRGDRDGFGRDGFAHFGREGGDRDEYLADALGITVEELQAARDRAFAAELDDAVAAGSITQAQADQMLAMRALQSYLDQEALLAKALGLSVDELAAAVGEGQNLADLMTAQGLDAATLRGNLQAAREAAVQQAVADGVITQDQADQFLSLPGADGFHGPGFHGRGHFHGGFAPFEGGSSQPTTPAPSDTSSGA